MSVVKSVPLLADAATVLMSFFVVFAIAGTQLLSGYLKKRCVSVETGIRWDQDGGEYFCGGQNECPEGYFCGKQNENPAYGVTNFDNIAYSLLAVFQCVTLEGWSDIMIMFQQAFFSGSFIIFIPVVFIGAFFLINLLLAVINSAFNNISAIEKEKALALKEKNRLKLSKKKTSSDDFDFDEAEMMNEFGID
jgi:hypothetical protein